VNILNSISARLPLASAARCGPQPSHLPGYATGYTQSGRIQHKLRYSHMQHPPSHRPILPLPRRLLVNFYAGER